MPDRYVPASTRQRAMRAAVPGALGWLSGALLLGAHPLGPDVGVFLFVMTCFFALWGCVCAVGAARNPRLGGYRPYVVAFDASYAVAVLVLVLTPVT